jgi:hypothetical protein
MKIPVFVSCPTSLSPTQEEARTVIVQQLDDNDLEPRALGRSDYPTELPLREVLLIARHCSGGIILGFEQFRAVSGVLKPGTSAEKRVTAPCHFQVPGTTWSPVFCLGYDSRFSFFAKLTLQEAYSTMEFPMYSFTQFHRLTLPDPQKSALKTSILAMGRQGSRTLL